MSRIRKYHVVTRMGDNHDLGVFNNGVDAVERAIVERYFLCETGGEFLPALQTERKVWSDHTLCGIQASVVSEVRKRATVLTVPEVVGRYHGAKRRVYENAQRSLYRKGLSRKDSHLRPFTKFEKQSLSKAPRIINPRSPRYNLLLGKYLKHTEKLYYQALNKVWGEHTKHTVIKGMNVFEAATVMKAKWDRFVKPVAVGLDASKYDMHVGVFALMFEHSFYNDVFDTDELRELLLMQLYNRGVAYCDDGEVSFQVPGTRCSGDLNTSLGNCVLMCTLIRAMCEKLGVTAELANNGDDCVLMMEQSDLDRVLEKVPHFFESYGFRMVVENPVYIFEQIEFCQSHPVKLGRGWAMVRNVRTCLKKDPMCLMVIQNDRVWRKWLGAVGECGMASVPGCPVLQSFYNAFRRSGVKATSKFKGAVFRNTGTLERGAGIDAVIEEVTADARASFYLATGITPDYQVALEDYYDQFEICGMESLSFRDGVVEVQPPPFLRHL